MTYPDTPDVHEDPEWFDEDDEGRDRELLELMDDEGEWIDEEDENFD